MTKPTSQDPGPPEAIVIDVVFEVAHDSDGLALIVLRHPNGATSQMQLEGRALAHVLERLDLAAADALIGLSFSKLAPALPANSGD